MIQIALCTSIKVQWSTTTTKEYRKATTDLSNLSEQLPENIVFYVFSVTQEVYIEEISFEVQ